MKKVFLVILVVIIAGGLIAFFYPKKSAERNWNADLLRCKCLGWAPSPKTLDYQKTMCYGLPYDCTKQIECGGIADVQCPEGYSCYIEPEIRNTVMDAMGVCRSGDENTNINQNQNNNQNINTNQNANQNTNQSISTGVTITTDKNTYLFGEEVNITVANHSDEAVEISSFYQIEGFQYNEDNQTGTWSKKVKLVQCPCGALCDITDYILLEAGGQREYTWNQADQTCDGQNQMDTQVPAGRYRLVITSLAVGKISQVITSDEFQLVEKAGTF